MANTFDGLPIVGQAFAIKAHWPTVVIQCSCEAETILVLMGTGNVVPCPACHRAFAIVDEMKVGVGQAIQRGALSPS